MIKDALINIYSVQGIDDDTDTIEFMTDGRFGFKEGSFYISYDESRMLDTGDEVKTQIYIKPDDSVILQRSGTIKSKILIEKGNRNNCFYSTPMGDLTIGVYGEKIEHNLTDNGGEIKLKYTIDSDLKLISRNEVNITIREVN